MAVLTGHTSTLITTLVERKRYLELLPNWNTAGERFSGYDLAVQVAMRAQEQVVELLREGHTLRAAAGLSGVATTTIEAWCRRDPEYAERLEIARSHGFARMERVLIGAAAEDPAYALEYLRHRSPDWQRAEITPEMVAMLLAAMAPTQFAALVAAAMPEPVQIIEGGTSG